MKNPKKGRGINGVKTKKGRGIKGANPKKGSGIIFYVGLRDAIHQASSDQTRLRPKDERSLHRSS